MATEVKLYRTGAANHSRTVARLAQLGVTVPIENHKQQGLYHYYKIKADSDVHKDIKSKVFAP